MRVYEASGLTLDAKTPVGSKDARIIGLLRAPEPKIGQFTIEEVISWLLPDDIDAPPPRFSDAFEGQRYNDPVHGPYTLDPEIAYISKLPAIRRLVDVKQLSFTYMIHNPAMHSRLEHMFGTYHIASQSAEHLKTEPGMRRVLTTAAFLHDAAHGPYGHSLEQIGELLVGQDIKRHGKLDKATLEWNISEPSHPLRLALQQIPNLDFELLRQVLLPGYWVDFEQSQPKHSYILDLLYSDVDVDRLDYVARDSYHVGPDFSSQFPWKEWPKRAVDNSVLVEHPPGTGRISLGFSIDIQGQIQDFLNYRRKLYELLYMTEVKISIDTMISHALYYCLREYSLIGKPLVREILKFTDDELKIFLKMVGPESPRAIVDSIWADKFYKPIYSRMLPPADPDFDKFVAKIQGHLGFIGRVRAEEDFSGNLPKAILTKVPRGLPPAIFSLPPYVPTDDERKKLAELEASREVLILTGEGPKRLSEARKPYYQKPEIIYSFHLLVPAEIAPNKEEIVCNFDEFVRKYRFP